MNAVADTLAATTGAALEARAWAALAEVEDPEIPVLSIVDLGIIRHVRAGADGGVEIGLAPTYSGCPATEVIRASVEAALGSAGLAPVAIREVLSPPWTSDWISPAGRDKLERYGIAPPAESVSSPRQIGRVHVALNCPRCGSERTRELSRFGSTPCKALHRCDECFEPFEYFKCI